MEQLDLNTFADGALAEKVAIEMQKIASNIMDPNTKAKAMRSLTIEIKFAPTEDREIVIGDLNVKSKLQSSQGTPMKFIVGTDGKTSAIAELKSGSKGQMMIDQDGNLADDKGQKINADEQPQQKVVSMYK